MDLIRKKAAGNRIWASMDETTDIEQRHVACFVFGVMDVEGEENRCYLANIAVLEKVNHSTISGFFMDSLKCIWPEQILYGNVFVVTTDAASYMRKAMTGLKVLFSKNAPRYLFGSRST